MKYFIGIVPIVLFLIIFNINDKEKNKKKLIISYLLFLLGMLGSYITYRVENKVGSYFPEMIDMNYFMVFIYSIFGVAVWEEGVKLFFLFVLTLKQKFNKAFSWINLSVICSLGYACFENIYFYIAKTDMFTAIVRMFTSIPSHVCFAIIMGDFFCKYKNTKKIKYLVLSLIIPTIIHAIYNVPLYKGSSNAIIISIIYLYLVIEYCVHRFYALKDR